MKMMFDGREIETGGGGLTQEEADGRYVKQGENLAESIEVSVVDPSTPPDVLEYAPVSRLELGLNGVVLSTVDRGGDILLRLSRWPTTIMAIRLPAYLPGCVIWRTERKTARKSCCGMAFL